MRVCAGSRCRMKRAEVIRPSQPSFWMPGRPARNLSVTSLPSPVLRKRLPGMIRISGEPFGVLPSAAKRRISKVADGTSWILPRLWFDPADFDPFGVRRDHAPRHQVVQRGAPQHGLLAAGVHRHVAADGRGIGRGRVDREHQPGGIGRFHHPLGDDAGTAVDGGDFEFHAGQVPHLHRAHALRAFRC